MNESTSSETSPAAGAQLVIGKVVLPGGAPPDDLLTETIALVNSVPESPEPRPRATATRRVGSGQPPGTPASSEIEMLKVRLAELKSVPPAEPRSGEKPETEHLNPVTILVFDVLTYQTRPLATIDACNLPWLEKALELAKISPVVPIPGGAPRGISSARGEKPILGTRQGPKGRKIMVLSVDTEVYGGTWMHGTELENCAIASREMGCDYNAVLKSFKQREDGLDISIVRGVTFCYADDYMAHINADVRVD